MNIKIIGISIAAFIGIIVLGSVLMPILDDATATTDTFTNEGLFYLKEVDADSDTVVLAWDHTKPYVIAVNDVETALPQTVSFGAVSIIMADTWAVRYIPGSSLDLFGDAGGIITTGNVANETDLTITLSGGVASFSTTELTQSYTTAYHISDNGPYVMKTAADEAYVNGDSLIYCTGRTNIAGGQKNINVTGDIDDGITATIIYPHGWTTSNVVITSEEVSTHIDLYKFSQVSFDMTDGNATATPTYSQVIVPYEVTAERSEHFTPGQNAIFAAMPVMIILAILLGVVALVIRSRMD